MGIPFYFYEITKNYPEILDQPKKSCDVLFFDFNSLIHPCAHTVLAKYTEECDTFIKPSETQLASEIIKAALEYTDGVIEKICPSKVYIVVDGVAPRAKMKQQRMRRFKSVYERSKEPIWDTNQITPGTKFMKELSKELHNWAGEYEPGTIVIDSWENAGEGEHKIYQTLLKESIKNQTVYIYGLDADLIILSLLERNNTLVLFRDDVNRDKIDYLDINLLKERLMESLTGSRNYNHQVILDYALLVCFLGNDFMDNIPTLPVSAVHTFVNNYKRLNLRLVNDNGCINYKNLCAVLGTLVKNEPRVYSEIIRKVYTLDIPETEQIYYYTDPALVHTKEKYYVFYGVNSVSDCCRDYLKTLNWVMGYYQGHSHSNWSFTCGYHCAPFVSDLVEFLQTERKLVIRFERDAPVTYLQQLFMVLPKVSLVKQGNEYINRLVEHGSVSEYFPEKLVVDLICKNKLFKGKVLLPEIPEMFLDVVI